MKNTFQIRILPICLILVINSNLLRASVFTEEFISSPNFVDKTLLLKEFFENQTRVFVTAPSGFGKTTNLKMIKKFCQVIDPPRIQSKIDEIFARLKIGQYDHIIKEHLGKHPVIYLDFKIDNIEEDEKLTREQNIRLMFKDVIIDAANDYRSLISSPDKPMERYKFALELKALQRIMKDETNITSDLSEFDLLLVQSVRFLGKFLSEHYNRTVVLLIDNYDYTIRKSFVDSGGRLNLFDKFIEQLLRESLKIADNESYSEIGYVMITSVTSLKFNFETNETMQRFLFYDDHRYTPYYGLTGKEIDDLVNKRNYNESDKSVIDEYCNGLETKEMCQKIYNTSCTMDYLESRNADVWISSSTTNFVWKLFKDIEYLDLFSKLLKHCPTRHGSHDIISSADFYELIQNDFNVPFVSGGNCTAISFLIQQAILRPMRGKSTFGIANQLARQQIAADLRYYLEKVANIDLKLVGSYLYDIFVSIKTNTTAKSNLDGYLTEAFRKFKPAIVVKKVKNSTKPTTLNDTNPKVNFELSKNSNARNRTYEETTLKFVHHSIIHSAALTNPNLKVIEDYPQPINYEKSRSNLERRCVTCIVHDNVALIVKNTDKGTTLRLAEERAHKFYSYSQPGIDHVRYLIVHVDDRKQVTTSVSFKKVPIPGNGTSKSGRKKPIGIL